MIPNMTTPEVPEETETVPVHGRDIEVQQLNDAQLLLLSREAREARKESVESERRVTAIGRIFDLFESVMVKEEDKEYIIELIIARKLKLADLTPFITAFSGDEEEEEKPRVRRGRAPAKR